MGEEQELRERIADAIAAFFGPDDSPHDAADAVLSLLEERQPCPHVVTGDEGTSYCTLAEEAVTALRAELVRVTNERDEAQAENERHRRANLVRAVIEGWTEEVDGSLTEYINTEGWDAVPWRLAVRVTEERDAMRSVTERYRDGWHDCMEGGKRTWHDHIASNEIGTHEPMSDAEAAFFADTEDTSGEVNE